MLHTLNKEASPKGVGLSLPGRAEVLPHGSPGLGRSGEPRVPLLPGALSSLVPLSGVLERNRIRP